MAEFSAAKKGDVLNFEYLSPKLGWSKLCPILDRCTEPTFRPIELGELNFEPSKDARNFALVEISLSIQNKNGTVKIKMVPINVDISRVTTCGTKVPRFCTD